MWEWLRQTFTGNATDQAELDPKTIDRLVNFAGPLIRTVGDYREQLAPLISNAMQITRALGEKLPKPVELTAASWRQNALLSLIFANPERMASITSASDEVIDWFARHPLADQAYAILAVTRAVENRYGIEELDGIIRQDVLQQVLVFRDHRFGALVETEPGLTQQAQCRGLEELAHHAARRINGLEAEREMVEKEIDSLRVAIRLGGATDPISASAMQRQRLKRLEFLIEELARTRKALAPEAQLAILMDALRTPEQELRFTHSDLHVDLLGILRQDDSHARPISLFEIEMIADEPVRRVLVPVIIPRETASAANGGSSTLFNSPIF